LSIDGEQISPCALSQDIRRERDQLRKKAKYGSKSLSVNCFYQREQRFFPWKIFWKPERALISSLKKGFQGKKIVSNPGEMNSQTDSKAKSLDQPDGGR